MMRHLVDFLGIGGFLLLSAGLALVHYPTAMVVAGGIMMMVAYRAAKR